MTSPVRTIAVIDDEFGLAEAIAALLQDEGYRVVIATNGRQGLEVIREHSPDLVLLDFMMPLLDGGAVLRALCAQPPPHPPVIVMTAASQEDVRAACPAATAYLHKPFGAAALLRAVEAALRGAAS